MHIAQLHNKYKNIGGEDVVVAREKELLEEQGHTISQYIVSNEGINTLSRKLKTAISLPYSYHQKKKVIAFLKKQKPDIVHVHNFLPILSPAIFYACKELDIPVVLTLHNYRLLCSNGLLYRDGNVCEECLSKRWGMSAIKNGCYQESSLASIFPVISNGLHSKKNTWTRLIDKVIFLSSFSKQIFDRSHIQFHPSQTVIKPNFVDDRGYSYEKEDYFLFVGRLSEEKGVLEILDACIKTNSSLKIVGEGPLEDQIKLTIEGYKNIEFLGFQNTKQLSQEYLKAKALINGSKMYETFGLTIIEAFSFGTPVITPSFGNAGKLITHTVNGIHYDHLEKGSLEKVLMSFDKNDLKNLNKEARKTFKKDFTAIKNKELLEKIYNNVLT